MIAISIAFDRTLDKFGISNAWLSRESGVNHQMISRFRNSKGQVQTDTLERLLSPLPREAKNYLFSQLLGCSLAPDLGLLVESLSSDDLHDLFDLLAQRVVQRSRSCSTVAA